MVLVALVASVSGAAKSPSAAAANGKMVFMVSYKAEKIRYESQVDFRCGAGPFGFFNHQADTINNWKARYSIAIPKRGDAGEVSDKADETSGVQPHAWHASGKTASCTGASTTYDCHASLAYEPERDGKAELSGDTFNGGKTLTLLIEPVKQWRIRSVHGNPCNRNNTHETGLLPASNSGYMPKMVKPKVNVSVSKLRNLKVGGDLAINVDSKHNAILNSQPPADCETITASDRCTESLSWNGVVRITRLD